MSIHTISIDDQLDYASSTTIPTGMLFALTASDDLEVLCALAKNPRIDADTIAELAFRGILDDVDTYYPVRYAIARRSDLPVAVAEGMRSDPSVFVRTAVAKNETVAPYLSWDGCAPAFTREVVSA